MSPRLYRYGTRLVALIPLVLVGCSGTPSRALSEPQPALDCGFGVRAHAWIDANANGTHDPTEAPLLGVTLVVSSTSGGLIGRGQPTTATTTSEVVGLGPCTAQDVAVGVEPPAGFIPTTAQPIIVRPDPSGRAPILAFGFRPAP